MPAPPAETRSVTSACVSSGWTCWAARGEDLGARRDEHLRVGVVATGLSRAGLGGRGEQHDAGARGTPAGRARAAPAPARPPSEAAARRSTPRRRRRTAQVDPRSTTCSVMTPRPWARCRPGTDRGAGRGGRWWSVNAARGPGHGAAFVRVVVADGHGTVGRGVPMPPWWRRAVAGRSGGRGFRTTRPPRRASSWGPASPNRGEYQPSGGSVSPRWADHSSAIGSARCAVAELAVPAGPGQVGDAVDELGRDLGTEVPGHPQPVRPGCR